MGEGGEEGGKEREYDIILGQVFISKVEYWNYRSRKVKDNVKNGIKL